MLKMLARLLSALAISGVGAGITLGFMLAIADAAPPAGADPNGPTAEWYRSLRQPGSGWSCCSVSDCRPTPARQMADGWQAWVDQKWRVAEPGWVNVPAEKILDQVGNAEGEAVLCYRPVKGHARDNDGEDETTPISSARVYCFIRPVEV